jgi:hypothetical protein
MKYLKIHSLGIGEMLLNSEFTVPTYQRSYSWKELQINNLLTDMTSAIKRQKDGKGDTHFLGSVVVIDRKGQAPTEVVDGQQRLATVSVILAAIRDFHLNAGKQDAAEHYDRYLQSYAPSRKFKPKLRLNEIDDQCYAAAILEIPEKRKKVKWVTPSHKRLLKAYDCATTFISNIQANNTAKATIDLLFEFSEFIRQNVQIIRVTVDSDTDAYTIFETLNDRHLLLSVADLLKNFIFQNTEPTIDESKANWLKMMTVLQTIKGQDRTVDFVRQLWGSMHGLVREKELFREIKNTITEYSEARELSAALASQVEDYAAVLDPENSVWSNYGTHARRALNTFSRLRIERIRSLLLAILNRFTEAEIKKALDFLRAASVRILVAGGFNGTVEEQVFQIAVRVHKREIKNTRQLARAMTFVPNDSVFRAQFESMSIRRPAIARFYLHELEDTDKGDDSLVANRDERVFDLEHVIPKSPAERAANWNELSKDEGERLTHRLGNLAIMPKSLNSQLNGKSFQDKVEAYKSCKSINLTKLLGRYETFGEAEIDDRQKKLAKLALEAWPIAVTRTQTKPSIKAPKKRKPNS